MSGPTPITANFRIVFLYTVSGIQHKQQNYLDCVPSADPSGFNTVPNPGFAGVGVSLLADTVFNLLVAFYDPTYTTFDGWQLFQRSGTIFIPVSSGASAVLATATGNLEKANMITLSGKDQLQKNLPVFFYEGLFGSASKFNSVAPISTAAKNLVNAYWNTAGTATGTQPWGWRRARSNVDPSRWIAFVTDTNEKLRRLRGIK